MKRRLIIDIETEDGDEAQSTDFKKRTDALLELGMDIADVYREDGYTTDVSLGEVLPS